MIFRFFIPFLILYPLITANEAVDTTGIRLASYWTTYNISVPLMLYITQFFFAPFQAGISDHFCRKKSLIIAMMATMISFIFMGIGFKYGIFFVFIGCIINGMLGNSIPIVRAALLDNDHKRNFRFHLALSICFIAIGSFVPLMLNFNISHRMLFIVVLILAIYGAISSFKYKDIKIGTRKGLKYYNFREEITNILIIFKKPHFYLSWIGYAFAELSFYVYYFRFEALKNDQALNFIPLSLGIGYILATFLLLRLKYSNKILIYIGSICAVTASFIFFIGDFWGLYNIVFYILAGIYAGGYALFIPALFDVVSRKEPIHYQGKIFGLIESSDTVAIIFGFFLIRISANWDLKFVSLLSLLLILISFFIFNRICSKHCNIKTS